MREKSQSWKLKTAHLIHCLVLSCWFLALQTTGKEKLLDKWILSRLSDAVSATNDGFVIYDFQKSTTAIYNFWLYELCDIYLVCVLSNLISSLISIWFVLPISPKVFS